MMMMMTTSTANSTTLEEAAAPAAAAAAAMATTTTTTTTKQQQRQRFNKTTTTTTRWVFGAATAWLCVCIVVSWFHFYPHFHVVVGFQQLHRRLVVVKSKNIALRNSQNRQQQQKQKQQEQQQEEHPQQHQQWETQQGMVNSLQQRQHEQQQQQQQQTYTHRRRRLSSKNDNKGQDDDEVEEEEEKDDESGIIEKPARFLMGIFTIATERERRDLIRKALAMFQDKRICSLGSVNGLLPVTTPPADHCELIYTFVFGANPNGPTQVLGNTNNHNNNNNNNNGSEPMIPVITTPPADFDTAAEPQNDITFLNIKENMEDGKSPTWFHYASQLMDVFDLDYAIKCDSDTFVRVDRFLDIAHDYLPRHGAYQRYYAGKMTWSFWRNHSYMEGQFYVLSKDLAALVSTMSLRYIHGVVNIEDSDIGYFIAKSSQHNAVHMIALRDKNGRLPWKHPLKKRHEYKDVLKRESRRLFGNASLY